MNVAWLQEAQRQQLSAWRGGGLPRGVQAFPRGLENQSSGTELACGGS